MMSPWLFNVYMDAMMKEVKLEMRRWGGEILGRGKRVEIACPLVCRRLGFVWRIGGGPKGNGGTFC